ncbi:MAG: ribonuclease III [Clostridiaceae bacterium]|nr:ribonuclease III [Clostridiaceae bacterium]
MSDRKPRKGLFFKADSQASASDSLEQVFNLENLAGLQQQVGYFFHDLHFIYQALTHSTYAYEHRQNHLQDNERLEFLGDAVLDLVISDALFRQVECYAEGFMTKTRALVVCENTLAQIAQALNLGQLLLLGRGETLTGGGDKPSNLANAMEAVFGAIYLDGGYEAAYQTIYRLLEEPLNQARSGGLVYDYKSRLLELVQSTRGASTVHFQILEESGPVHERVFSAGVFLDDQMIASGSGCSKKDAEQQAAKTALEHLHCNKQGCLSHSDEDTGG